MYSKERGYINEPPAPRHLSYRQPERPRMQVPPNYSGHAIVDGEERPLGRVESLEIRDETTPSEGPVPRFDDLPRVSELGESRYRPPSLTLPLSPYEPGGSGDDLVSDGEEEEPVEDLVEDLVEDRVEDRVHDRVEDRVYDMEEEPATVEASFSEPIPAKADTSAPRSPSLFSLSRFPFGHGIGWEELLIMGLIWLLLHENAADGRSRGDLDETVILLGLLLLMG